MNINYYTKYLATRQVAINLLLELTEDGNDLSGKQLERVIDKQIKLQLKVMSLPKLNWKDL